MGGDDRLVITGTPASVDGGAGAGADRLIVQGGGSVSLTADNFIGIEQIFVRNGTTLDLSQLQDGQRVSSQSTEAAVTIVGSAGDDRLVAGKAGDTLTDGGGADRLIGGTGSDTFEFVADGQRGEVRKFDIAHDVIDLSAFDLGGIEDLNITQFGGKAVIAFDHGNASEKIVLFDTSAADLTANGNFLFA